MSRQPLARTRDGSSAGLIRLRHLRASFLQRGAGAAAQRLRAEAASTASSSAAGFSGERTRRRVRVRAWRLSAVPNCRRTSPAQSQCRSMMSALRDDHRDQVASAKKDSALAPVRREPFRSVGCSRAAGQRGSGAHCTCPRQPATRRLRRPVAIMALAY